MSLLRDLQFSLRQLRRAKVFAAVAILTLALGIGSNTAIFSVFYSVLLRPLGFRDADRIVMVNERAKQFPSLSVSWQNLRDWETQSTSFEEFGAARVFTMALTGNGEPEQVPSEMISGNLLHLLGVNVAAGRGISPSDDQPSSSAVALLGYNLWQRKYSGSTDVLGKSITLDRQSYTIVGIMPKGYELLQQTPDVVIAMGPWAAKLPDDRSWHPGIFAIARLKQNVTLAQARAEMSTIAHRLYEKYPNDNIAIDAVVNLMHEQLVSQSRPALLTLLGAVIFVLLIACGNIANLMLTRATARRRELSIRISLGASDWQIIRQLILEGLLLSLMGAVAGVALAYALLPSLIRLAGTSLPPNADVRIDMHVLLFTALLSICAGVFFGVAPAGHVRISDLRSILNESERAGVGRQARALRNILVVSEISLALLLLMGAGLFVRSLNRLSAVSLGFSDDHILVADLQVPPPSPVPADAHRNMDFYENTLRELHSLPGVRSVAAASVLPVSGQGSVIHFNIQGRPPRNGSEYIMANYRTVSAEYFQTLRIPLLQGRWIETTDRENMPPIVVINEAMAKTYFPNQNPIGKKMQIGATPENDVPWMMIVGVVGNVKQSLVADMPTEFYVPYRQANEVLPVRTMSVVLRTEVDPRALIPDLRATVHRVNPNQPVVKIRTMEDNVAQNFSQPRFRTLLLVVFAGIALLIAAVGVYGVMAYATVQRAGEMAIRMALGCSVEKVFMLVVTDGLRLTLIGIAIGTAFGLALSRWLKSLLFGVSATDALTLAGSICVVLVAGVAATLIPARRASRIQIATMMREN
ncbi:ABC transporter permease [Occallatibacter savannae]|uniref:ABC transporter permease n=1 Tax=Occallatibacter savannae TaxID=1002691 RepID=UPI0013A54ADA|nr:ABC transporter permease [Occallatibacter savannae]